MTNTHYLSDDNINRRMASNPSPGDLVDFNLLLPLDFDLRVKVDAEAHTMANYIGGRRSDCIRRAIDTHARGFGFPYQGRAAAHRNQENELNKGNMGPRRILPMN